MPAPTLRLGTRRSPLALAQAEEARARLCAAQGWSLEAIELVPVTASGDKVQDRPLAEIGGKALWTKELDAALIAGEIDFAVHSAKDIETLRPAEIMIAAVLEREDVRDVLVGAKSLAALAPGARVGTSAPRRAAQLLHFRPDCQVVPIRGNVATRLAKLEAGEVDATLLAKAGLNRLGLTDVGSPLDPWEWIPAAGQGAIAIECRSNDSAVQELLKCVDHSASRSRLFAERRLLSLLKGDCHSPIAVYTELDGAILRICAAVFSPEGSDRSWAESHSQADWPHGPVDVAEELMDNAPDSIRVQFGWPEPPCYL